MRPHRAAIRRPHTTADPDPRVRQRLRPAAHPRAGLALLLDGLALLLPLPSPARELGSLDASDTGGFVLGATFPIVGWLIASRRSGNAMGRILLGVGLSQAADRTVAPAVTGWLRPGIGR